MPDGGPTELRWTNLNAEEAWWGQKVWDHSDTAPIKVRAHCEPTSQSIHSLRDITLKCDQLFKHSLLHSAHYEVLIN